MLLLLMRHADALDEAASDYARVLSDKGRKQAERMGCWLKAICDKPPVIVSSPYPRAFETADIVAESLGDGSVARQDERLAPGLTPDLGSSLIHEFGDDAAGLLLVGHAPDLARLACHLIGAKESGIELRKGAVACLETVRAGHAGSTLQWLIHPKL